MNKLDKERSVFDSTIPLLSNLYGTFEADPEQTDRPDAAIVLKQNNKRVGIEITSVDKKNDQEYFNNTKISRDVELQQVKALAEDGIYSSKPTKKLSIAFPYDYIFESVIKKADKYPSYVEAGVYDEMLILAFSEHLSLEHESFNHYLKPWTAFLLAQQKFPFDKVIFVCKRTSSAVVIYDKTLPIQEPPKRDLSKESGVTKIHGPVLPFGKKINIKDFFNEKPSVPTKKKSRKAKRAKK